MRSGRRLWLLALAGMLATPGVTLRAQTAGLALRSPEAGPSGRLRLAFHRGYPAVSATELREEALPRVRLEGAEMSGEVDGSAIELRAGSPFVRRGASVYQLGNVPYLEDGRLWVPAELLTQWLPKVTDVHWTRDGSQLTLAKVGSAGGTSSAPAARTAPAPPEHHPFRVVIDAGHGGSDPGARGPRGTREKDVTLAIARKVRDLLAKAPDIVPIMTRDSDTLIALRDRSHLAVIKDADLFLSIHANASESRGADGFETYFLSPARNERSRKVAMRENASIKYENPESRKQYAGDDEMNFILTSLDQYGSVLESRRFAGFTQNALRSSAPGPDRGVKQAGFWVLVGASGNMPAVLAEVGFITNPHDELVLRSSTGQRKIAHSLANAVEEYFDGVETRLSAGRESE